MVAVPGVALVLVLAGATPTAEAERLAAEAIRLAASRPEDALAQARRALALTAEFEPTAFVEAGRKGEVVEDAYLAARREYRRHRARVYEAVGESLARAGRHAEAVRYLRRGVDLGATAQAAVRLARSLVALGRGREALDALLAGGARGLEPEGLAVAEQAADAAALPSLQAELDRARLQALLVEPRVEPRDGPLRLPEARLSTGAPFRLDVEGVTLLYLAEASCRSCSEDLEALKRAVPSGVRLAMAPAAGDDDALRGVLALYRYDWPVLLGRGAVAALGARAPAVVALARRGWSGAVVSPPFGATLPPVVEALGRVDVRETIPRPAWSGRPVDRAPPAPRPALLGEGLAPGEDEPAPEGFARAVAAYRGGRAAEALRLFESLEARGDGWLLPPEARLDRALCLAALGRREEARRLLLLTGDSRFQDAVDRALERVAARR